MATDLKLNKPDEAVKTYPDNIDVYTDYLKRNGLSTQNMIPIGEDGARRRCFRVFDADKTFVLMDAIPDDHPDSVPGHKSSDFVRIETYLSGLGINTPTVYDVDYALGFLLVKDFGDDTFKKAAEKQGTKLPFYGLATNVLQHIKHQTMDGVAIDLPSYYDSHVHVARQRVVDWYMPAFNKSVNPDGLTEDYLSVWAKIESTLPDCPQGFCHVDYHFENLMYMPNNVGLHQCGVLDFQHAMLGPAMYDVANLLEDARVDVPDDVRAEMLSIYCKGMTPLEQEVFDLWYRVIATQFHCRIIGQFIRLAVVNDRPHYLDHIPRLERYIVTALDHPVLAPLSQWFSDHKITFDGSALLEPALIQGYIRPDAI